jgi:hypothetical protein
MKTFKELFESSYGEDSFNDEFLIDAISANGIHESWEFKLIKKLKEMADNNGYIKVDVIDQIINKGESIYQTKHESLGYWYNISEEEYNAYNDLGQLVRIV